MRTKAILITAASVLLVGCGAEPGPTPGGEPSPAQRSARIELVKSHPDLNDLELAHLCPALYPSDVLKDPKKYQLDRLKATASFSSADLAQAAAAGCGKSVPIAKPSTASSSQTSGKK
jgi:hypothetical protein